MEGPLNQHNISEIVSQVIRAMTTTQQTHSPYQAPLTTALRPRTAATTACSLAATTACFARLPSQPPPLQGQGQQTFGKREDSKTRALGIIVQLLRTLGFEGRSFGPPQKVLETVERVTSLLQSYMKGMVTIHMTSLTSILLWCCLRFSSTM
jgi:hypothetical protein